MGFLLKTECGLANRQITEIVYALVRRKKIKIKNSYIDAEPLKLYHIYERHALHISRFCFNQEGEYKERIRLQNAAFRVERTIA